MTRRLRLTTLLVAAAWVAAACGGNPPATTVPPDPGMPGAVDSGTRTPPAPPERPPDPPPVPMEPTMGVDSLADLDIDTLNSRSPFKPAFFKYDSDELDEEARQALTENAELLRKYTSWVITIEGHCDERGTPEYNLALGDRRALAAKNFLLSLGISTDRVHTVSYGKEFPFNPGHDEGAWADNRRAHFVVVSK